MTETIPQPAAEVAAETCRCGKPIVACASLPSHIGCSSGYGWIHAEPGWGHSCRPRSGAPYARPGKPS